MDTVQVLYGLHAVVDLVGLAMMTWWIYTLRSIGKYPSIFYVCLWLMFLGGIVSQTLHLCARTLYLQEGAEVYKTFVSGWWWPARILFNLTANITVVIVLLYRRFLYTKVEG